MSTPTAAPEADTPIRSPGFGWGPDDLAFDPLKGTALLGAVCDAIEHRAGMGARARDTAGSRFLALLRQAEQRFDRTTREAGPGVEEDALRAGLEKLEAAADVRKHLEDPDDFAEDLSGEARGVIAPLTNHLHAASYLLDWAIAGARARLDEMEEDAA